MLAGNDTCTVGGVGADGFFLFFPMEFYIFLSPCSFLLCLDACSAERARWKRWRGSILVVALVKEWRAGGWVHFFRLLLGGFGCEW